MSNNLTGSWYLECFPSEISAVFEKLTGKSAPPMPAWTPDTPLGNPRPVEQILLFSSLDEGCPPAAWDALFNAVTVRHTSRIHRRQAHGAAVIGITVDASWACIIEPQESGTWLITFFPGTGALATWLAGVMSILEVPAMQVSAFRKAPAAMIAMIGAMCDLFNERYPHPDPQWAPTGNPEFSAQMLEEYFRHPERSSWYQHLRTLMPELPADPGMEQVDILLQVLRNENLLGESEEGEGIWYMSTGLLWAIRMMAWWDLGIAMPEHPDGSSVCLQASCSWIFSRNPDNRYTLEAIQGPAVIHHVKKWLDTPVTAMPKMPPPPPPAVKKASVPPPPPPNLGACPACHHTVLSSARFCPNCGTKLKS